MIVHIVRADRGSRFAAACDVCWRINPATARPSANQARAAARDDGWTKSGRPLRRRCPQCRATGPTAVETSDEGAAA